MKILEVLNELAGVEGYWEMQEQDGVRQWHPVFDRPGPDALFPFVAKRNAKLSSSQVNSFQAFDILPNKRRKDIDQQALFGGLEDALKRRSQTDVISDNDFNILLNKCSSLLVSKLQLRKQNPRRMFITTPPSSSDIADTFAQTIQRDLGIADDHAFYGHFAKRDVIDVIEDIEVNTNIPEIDRTSIVDRLLTWYSKRDDTTIKIKDLWNGHRAVLEKYGISLFDLVKEIELPEKTVPYLLIVDDNVQSGSTARQIANLFVNATGVQPGNVYSLAMFKYP
jgi:hypothetical protein